MNAENIGQEMHDLITRLFPITRSITGNGVRETLGILSEKIPLDIHEVASGTPVFDWTVPKEWNIRDAFIKNSKGEKIVDFHKSNLHVLNYSVPIHKKITLHELKKHLFTLPEQPDWIPYRTSYYNENWGFCLSYNQFKTLRNDKYEVFIDSTLENGSLTYGELIIHGVINKEVLISTHICHPSLANDNLSGIALTTFLAKTLLRETPYYTYHFLFIPGTIGAIAWLALNEEKTKYIKHGLVAALLGDSGPFTYKKTRQESAEIDWAVQHVLSFSEYPSKIVNFSPYGYDERQFCSPGFNLPVGTLTRTPHGEFPEYHTSGDNLNFVKHTALALSYRTYLSVINILDNNKTYRNLNPKCEPQLGKRGLYQAIGGTNEGHSFQQAMLWVLNLSDGTHSLLDIARRSQMKFEIIHEAATILESHYLLEKI